MTDDSIWRDPAEWPRDRAGYIFLARAIQEIGRAMYRDTWTGNEAPAPLPCGGYVKIQSEAEQEGTKRFSKVQDAIIDAAEAEELLMVARPIDDGRVISLTRDYWHADNLTRRFRTCRIDPGQPFGDFLTHWIFAGAEGLAHLITSFEAKTAKYINPRQRAIQYLTPLLTARRPDGMNRKSVQKHCMETFGVSDRRFRSLWDGMEKDPSWSKPGPSKSRD